MTAAAPAGVLRERLRSARKILRSRRRLERLNHVLVPEKKPDRDRLRRSWRWRLLSPAFLLYASLSRDGRGLLLLTMLVGLAGVDITQSQVHLLFAALAGLVMGSLALRPFFRAKGVEVEVETSARVSVGAPQRFLVHLDHRGKKPILALRVASPFLPWDGRWSKQPHGVAALRPRERATVIAEARFSARGEHHLDPFEIGVLVPLGLAVGPRRLSDGARFLVVPKIANVVDLTLEHRVPERQAGHVTSRAPGESDIVGVRPYRPGDALRHLHARTWARTGVPHVKSYVSEQSERVGLAVLVDGDEVTDEVKEATISLAAGVAAAIVRRGGGIDAVLIDDRLTHLASRSGKAALDGVLDRLATHVLEDVEKPCDGALDALAPELSTLVIVSAHDGPSAAVDRLRARGLPVHWLRVVATDEVSLPSSVRHVRVDHGVIDRGEAVAA